MKLIKYIIYTILVLIILGVIGLVVLTHAINPNNFKQPIQNQISQVLNRDSRIEGDISWRFFPSLALSAQQVEIDNPDGFQSDTFASIGEIAFKVELLPLLHGQINVNNINLDKMKVDVEFNEAGESNLDTLGGQADASANTNTDTDTVSNNNEENNSDESGYLPLSGLKIDNVSLNNSQINYHDQGNDLSLSIDDINFNSHDIASNQAFPIELNFNFNAEQDGETLASGSSKLDGTFKIDIPQLLSSSFDSMEDLLNPVEFQGKLVVTPLQVSSLNIDDLNADLQIEQRKIEINPVTAHLYQGMANSNIMMDFSNDVPTYSFEQSINDIEASDLFSDLIGTSRITGKADFSMQLNATGENSSEIVNSLNGTGSYEFSNGQLQGINISYLADVAAALFNGETPPPASEGNQTEFGHLTGTLDIVNGVIQNQDMLLESSTIQANGAGSINLNNEQINYQIQAKILNLAENNTIEQLQDSFGGGIPLLVSGTLENIQVAPDVQAIVNSRARSFISDQLNNLTTNNSDNENGDDTIADIADQAKGLLNRILQ